MCYLYVESKNKIQTDSWIQRTGCRLTEGGRLGAGCEKGGGIEKHKVVVTEVEITA